MSPASFTSSSTIRMLSAMAGLGQHDADAEAAARARVSRERAAVPLDDRARDREPESRPAGFATARALHAIEPLREPGQFLFGNTRSAVFPLDHDTPV